MSAFDDHSDAAVSRAPPRLAPRLWYADLTRRQEIVPDPAQERAVDRLEHLHQELAAWRRPFLPWLAGRRAPMGLYLWGGVGRGKSFLMDHFFTHAPVAEKRRLHFHRFMQEAHGQLAALKGKRDPLAEVARRFAARNRLLCLDEFHVTDIADAMILGRLLKELLDRGTVLVITSNLEPGQLYANGLQRERFLPTIALIRQRLETVEIENGRDYRLSFLERAEVYHLPGDGPSLAKMKAIFDAAAEGPLLPSRFFLQQREVAAIKRAAGAVWFDFTQLCGTPRSQSDYLELALEYPILLLSGIPRLAPEHSAEARRLTWLVDVCYDQRVKLILAADVPPEELYRSGLNSGEFARTVSRLQEMQSRRYLALPHQTS